MMIEAPRLLFPFARQIVSSVVSSGGFPPLLINPIDFADLYRRQLAAANQTA
jgi:preprotein translocase subunit SecB